MGRAERRIARVMVHVEMHCAHRIRLADLAAVAGVHPSHLIREFQKHVGCSPIAYVGKVRMARAALLLIDSDTSVKEVGLSVGFRRPEAFSTAFKHAMGCSPRAYRDRGESANGEMESPARISDSHLQGVTIPAQPVPV